MKLGLIVEGHGDAEAIPILLRRVANDLGIAELSVDRPWRCPRGKLVKEQEIRRVVEGVARRIGPGQPILVVADADDDCPGTLGPQILAWAKEQRGDRETAVVLAKREYEAWLVAAAPSIAGWRGLPPGLAAPSEPEAVENPKAWLESQMSTGYSETLDQPALTAVFDWRRACAAPSFRKLIRDFCALVGATAPNEAKRQTVSLAPVD